MHLSQAHVFLTGLLSRTDVKSCCGFTTLSHFTLGGLFAFCNIPTCPASTAAASWLLNIWNHWLLKRHCTWLRSPRSQRRQRVKPWSMRERESNTQPCLFCTSTDMEKLLGSANNARMSHTAGMCPASTSLVPVTLQDKCPHTTRVLWNRYRK